LSPEGRSRPLATTFTQEPLEEQFHTNRVYCCDFKRVTNSRVSRTAATLDKYVIQFAEADNIPDDQEVAFKPEPLDKSQFSLNLLDSARQQGFVMMSAIAMSYTFFDTLAQERCHRVALGHRVAREFIAQVIQPEGKPCGQLDCFFDSTRQIAKE
jgi:hypothetical protein